MLRVHSYESMGTFDGPGLRLVVFLQGCNFRCLYCANPDTIEAGAGTLTDPAEILRMAVDQKPFFGRRGGVTFSGGEPTFQAAELVGKDVEARGRLVVKEGDEPAPQGHVVEEDDEDHRQGQDDQLLLPPNLPPEAKLLFRLYNRTALCAHRKSPFSIGFGRMDHSLN